MVGDSIWPEDPSDRFAGLTFRITIAPDNAFRATAIDELSDEVKRRAAPGALRQACSDGAQLGGRSSGSPPMWIVTPSSAAIRMRQLAHVSTEVVRRHHPRGSLGNRDGVTVGAIATGRRYQAPLPPRGAQRRQPMPGEHPVQHSIGLREVLTHLVLGDCRA